MSVEGCRIPQPHRLAGMKTIITGVQTFDFSIDADEWRRQSHNSRIHCTDIMYISLIGAHDTSPSYLLFKDFKNFKTIQSTSALRRTHWKVVFWNGGASVGNSTSYIQAIRNYLTGYFLDVHIYHGRVPVTGIYLPRALAHLINIPHILSGDIQCLNVPR